MSQKTKVIPPKVKYVPMINWDLKDLKTTFEIPEFERRVDRSHLQRMVNAILSNDFSDNVLRGVQLDNGKIQIIDAQHRIQAFLICHEKYGLKKYDFHLFLYPKEKARIYYRSLNKGKRLEASGVSLSLDDGGVPFFNELRELLYHYRNAERLSFVDILFMWRYIDTGNNTARADLLESYLKTIDGKTIEFFQNFLKALYKVSPGIPGNPLYHHTIMRNLARVSHEEKYNQEQIEKFLRKVKKAKIPEEVILYRSNAAVFACYEWLTQKIIGRKK